MNNIAKPGYRLLANLIDLLIFSFLPLLLLFWISASTDLGMVLGRSSTVVVVVVLLYPILYTFLNSFLISFFGGTIGKILTGTKIVSPSGEKIGFWRAFFRNHIGYMVSGVFLWLGFIWVLVDKERRAWHDQIADTYVIIISKWLPLVGVLVLIVMAPVDTFLLNSTIKGLKKNSSVYVDLFNLGTTAIQKSSSGLNSSYSSQQLGFEVQYPNGWYKQGYEIQALSYKTFYFSPTEFDFSDETKLTNYKDGYVSISVSSTSDWFRYPEFQNKAYQNAKEFLDAQWVEERESQAKGNLPTTPGPSLYMGLPTRPFVNGAIEVQNMRVVGANAPSFIYWYLNGNKLYEFQVVYPQDSNLRAEFEKNVLLMTSTFKVI